MSPEGQHRRRRSRSRSPPRKHKHRSRSRSRNRSPQEHRHHRHRSRSRDRHRREQHRSRSRSGDRGHNRTHAQPAVPASLPPPPPLPEVGSVQRARVETVRPFGVFVSLPGVHRHGLVPANCVSEDMRFAREDTDEDKVKALEWLCARGAEVWVKVTAVTQDEQRGGMRLACAMNVVDQDTGADLDPGNTRSGVAQHQQGQQLEQPPALNSIHKATVQDIKPYGLFVSLPGHRRSGLVHSSQVSEHLRFTRDDDDDEKVASLSGIVSVGEAVWVKVVELEPDAGGRIKVGCSMKLVSQSNGADLDASGTHYRPRGATRDGAGDEFGRPGQAAGVRSGVVDWGHHLADVTTGKQVGGQSYELLPDEDEAPPPAEPPSRVVTKVAMLHAVGGGFAGEMLAEPAPAEVHIGSVEEAQAILERYQRKAAKREAKKARKEDKRKRKKERKESKRARSDSSPSSKS